MLKGTATSEGTAAYRAAQGARTRRRTLPRVAGARRSPRSASGPTWAADDDATDALYEAAVEQAVVVGDQRRRLRRSTIGTSGASAPSAGRSAASCAPAAWRARASWSRPREASCPSTGPPPPGLLRPGDLVAGSHCMTPRYLEDQIERSRVNLDLETIDIYYLHNPETQLGELPRREVMRRLRAAFEFLEGAARDRRIGLYGTATWSGYRQPQSARDFLSLPDLVALAEEVGGPEHRFRVVQLPYNLAMTEAFTLANQRQPARARPAARVGAPARRLRHELRVDLPGPARDEPARGDLRGSFPASTPTRSGRCSSCAPRPGWARRSWA